MSKTMTGAEMVVTALKDQGVDTLFGYPGGAVLPIYDALFHQNHVRHVLVRHEQGAAHAAEGYARSTGKVGVLLVTSGPGATNAVTGLTDALDGFDPARLHHRSGADASHRVRCVPGMRHDRHHATLHEAQLSREADRGSAPAFSMRRSMSHRADGPGPVVVDIPKDVQFASGAYVGPSATPQHKTYRPKVKGDLDRIRAAVEMMANAKRPVFYTGGGVINSGPAASALLRELVRLTGFPDHVHASWASAPIRRPTSNGSACSACTGPTKQTTRCMIAT